jgi:type II secretory pathway pseudopilin PulG
MTLALPIFIPATDTVASNHRASRAFTLLEIMVAAVAASIILIAVYGIFYNSIKMRDSAMARSRDARLRARAVNVIRNDLRNAFISGGILASTLQGDVNGTDGPDSEFPGYLKLTTTTGKDTDDEMYGDVQQVEYYIQRDKNAAAMSKGGVLTRVVTRDLLDTDPNVTHEEHILSGVQSFQVYFYDGTQWQTTWQMSGTSTSGASTSGMTGSTTSSGTSGQMLPAAIRVDIQRVADETPLGKSSMLPPPPLEILVPWVTMPFISGTNYAIGSGTVSPLPENQ